MEWTHTLFQGAASNSSSLEKALSGLSFWTWDYLCLPITMQGVVLFWYVFLCEGSGQLLVEREL